MAGNEDGRAVMVETSQRMRWTVLLAFATVLLPAPHHAAAHERPVVLATADFQAKPAAGTVAAKGAEQYSKCKAADDKGDYADAMRWYRQAAEAGNTDAMNRLGVMYDNGQGAAEDPVQAVAWFRKAAEAGDPAGMNNLASMYGHGRGVSQDEGQAVRWYRKAADAGDEWGTISLGMMYENGRGVPKDLEQAVAWYRKAAAAGSETAKAILERLGRK
jgi:TPR repeat protein